MGERKLAALNVVEGAAAACQEALDAKIDPTHAGLHTVLFYTRVYTRILRPAMAPTMPEACAATPQALRQFHAAEQALSSWCEEARLAAYKT